MQAKPEEPDLESLTSEMKNVEGVCDVHHLNVWRLDESPVMLGCHIVIEKEDLKYMEEIKSSLKKLLHDSTLEFEFKPYSAHQHETEHLH